jgi:peptidoglycan/xylan/chitin deacetylase (PgdA/CDA1 family)
MFGRQLVAVICLLAAFAAFAARALAAEPTTPEPRVVVLCYHIIQSPRDPKMEISREQFLRQMSYLASTGYNVIPLATLIDYLSGKVDSIPESSVVITFDDGWKCTYTEVFPEMKRLKLPFTVFIYPDFIGQSAYAMNWSQVKELAAAGVEIEGHSYSHSFLTKRRHRKLSDAEYAKWLEVELSKSRKVIESKTGKPVRAIAYPFGDYDAALVKQTTDSGYAAGLTCDYGSVARESDRFRIHRVSIYADTSFDTFREHLGVRRLPLEASSPRPGRLFDRTHPVVSARIRDFKEIDPASIGMALLPSGSGPVSYNANAGEISMTVREPLRENRQQAIIWARDVRSGKRVEALWTFYLNEIPAVPAALPPARPLPEPTEVVEHTNKADFARPIEQAAPPSHSDVR